MELRRDQTIWYAIVNAHFVSSRSLPRCVASDTSLACASTTQRFGLVTSGHGFNILRLRFCYHSHLTYVKSGKDRL